MSAADSGVCPACGIPLQGDLSPRALCAACLLSLALREEHAAIEDEYRVVGVLWGDESRTIYLAQEQVTGNLVTLDVVRASAVAAVTPSLFEARLAQLRALCHPAIAAVLGGRITSEGDYCVVAEYVPGRGTAAYASSPGVTAGAVLAAFERLCDAVAHAHDRQVVHGRLGPDTVTFAVRAGGVVPVVTGYAVCDPAAREADDVAGLAQVLAAVSSCLPMPERCEAFLARALSGPGVHSSLGGLRDAARALLAAT